jgi:hypothetical protein
MKSELPEIPKVPSAPGVPWSVRWREPEMLVGIVALLIGLGSLCLGSYEAMMQRHHARAAVWPHLEISLNNGQPSTTDPADRLAAIHVRNSGVGPAVIEALVVSVDNKPVRSWDEVFAKVLPAPPHTYTTSELLERVLRAGDDVTLIGVPEKDLPADIRSRLSRIKISVAYASVFGDHWVLESSDLLHRSQAKPVSRCPLVSTDGSSF